MCGLCGVITPKSDRGSVGLFQSLMVVSTLRGADGAGMALVPKKGNKAVRIVKNPNVTAAELVLSQDFNKYRNMEMAAMIGHARYPTAGGGEYDDVHPHIADHIIGTHNGTLTVVNGVPVAKKASDSALLFQSIATNGIDATIKNTQGSYAIVYINKQTGTLNFLRNHDRPLYFAHLEGEPELYWGSESSMLAYVLGRSSAKKVNIVNLPANTHATFQLYNSAKDGVVLKSQRPLEGMPVIKTPIRSNVPAIIPEHLIGGKQTEKLVLETGCGGWYEKEEIIELLNAGCENCRAALSFDDFQKKDMVWFKRDEFMCKECIEHDHLAVAYAMSFGSIKIPPHIIPIKPIVH